MLPDTLTRRALAALDPTGIPSPPLRTLAAAQEALAAARERLARAGVAVAARSGQERP